MEDKEIIEAEIIEESVITDEEAKAVFELEKKYLESYVKNKDKMELKEWLVTEMKQDLPERKAIEVEEMAVEIIESIKRNDENIESLKKAKERGMSNEQWFSKKIKEATQNMELNKVGEYLQSIDDVLLKSNTNLLNEITTKSGMINMNPNLDGFIAEQELVNSFNNNAVLEGSKYRAEALTPDVYGKNSFDIVIRDKSGKIVHQYQSKFGATAEDTIRYIKKGNYNNQQIIVPKEQVAEVQKAFPGKTIIAYIGGTDIVKTKGIELEKPDVKRMQKDAQTGKTENLKKDWNSYEISDLAKGIGESAVFAGLSSVGITAGFDIATRVVQGREIKGEEIIETALRTGADTGVKAAVSGAVKVASERGFISVIPKGTPAGMIANVVHVGIENIKVMGKIVSGELTVKEGIDKMGETTVGIVGGIVASGVGTKAGATAGALIGSVLGPVGTAVGAVVGGFVGGTVGYIAGSEVGKEVAKVAIKVKDTAVKVAVGIVETGARVVSSVWEGAKSVCSWLFG